MVPKPLFEQVQALVHQYGVRSLAGGRNDAAWGTDSPTYFKQANDEIFVCVQIENVPAPFPGMAALVCNAISDRLDAVSCLHAVTSLLKRRVGTS